MESCPASAPRHMASPAPITNSFGGLRGNTAWICGHTKVSMVSTSMRRADGHLGLTQPGTAGAQVTGDHPTRGAVEQARDVINAKTVLANARPGGFDVFPACWQLELQTGHQLRAVLLVQMRPGHKVLPAQHCPGRGHARIEH